MLNTPAAIEKLTKLKERFESVLSNKGEYYLGVENASVGNIDVEDLAETIEMLEEYDKFLNWAAYKVCTEDLDVEDFRETCCEKLHKLGFIIDQGDQWLYDPTSEGNEESVGKDLAPEDDLLNLEESVGNIDGDFGEE